MASYNNPRFVRPINQGGPLMREFPEAAQQTFLKGQLVLLTAGEVVGFADNGALVLGIAMEDASGTQGTLISVQIIRVGDEISMKVYTGGAVDAATSANIGVKYNVDVTSNECRVDLNAVNVPIVVPWQIVDAAAGGEIIVTFMPAALQYHVGS